MGHHRDATIYDIIAKGFERDGRGVSFHDTKKKGKKCTRHPHFINGRVIVSVGGVKKALQIREPGSILYI